VPNDGIGSGKPKTDLIESVRLLFDERLVALLNELQNLTIKR
jgi:hypothetical protein